MSFGKENSISSMMNELQVESELSLVKVVALDDIEETEIGGFKIEYKEDESKFDVPRWVAHILVDKNLVKLADIGIELDVLHAIDNEKSLASNDPLPLLVLYTASLMVTAIVLLSEVKDTDDMVGNKSYTRT